MSSPLALDVADLSKKYGDRMALSHANFEVPMGSICGFVGPNGSGKTTTIRMLLGLITPSTGGGHVLGESITQPEKYLPKVGAMIEGPAFYPALTGKQNLAVLAKLGGFSTDQIQKLLELVDLGDRGDSKFKTYSLGMKQRLGIAAALLPNPKLLVLDEPTNGLDPAGIHEIRTLLRKLADEGTTVFVSSHLLSEIEMISDYLVMLREGKVIFSGKTSDLLAAQKPLILAKPENQNDLVKLNQIAQGLGIDSKIKEDLIEASADANFAAKLNKAAFDAGITLTSLTSIRPTLEETFFEMTVN
ncbi:MAG TPA: ABC transporter ATP-binding protein [Candidatus Nanopelagicus sp.]|nr:ABC transporter ATP-binding protein [Candidatus Nanopelagicus sp.]